jgi:hypothetical protein
MENIVNKAILLSGWIGSGMLIIDLIFFAPKGPFLVNFTWLSKVGVILGALCFILLFIRRLLFNPSEEPKWK